MNLRHNKHPRKRSGLLAISPIAVLILLFAGMGFAGGGFSSIPLLIVFSITVIYALCISRDTTVEKRLEVFSKGAGAPNLLLMVWIFMLAGAFANAAKDMGAVEATVGLTLQCLPTSMVLAGAFIAACVVSLAVGTSVGTIVALVPIASGLAESAGLSLPLTVAAVTGGAFFGDNLSFISDTTIAATRTQGCRMKDKFKVNFLIVLPAALLALLFYVLLGTQTNDTQAVFEFDWWLVIPYAGVLVASIAGMNVSVVLVLGCLLTGLIGIAADKFTMMGWISSMAVGINSMGELILISMLAGGLMEVIRHNGGIVYLMRILTKRIRGKRSAEYCIGLLVGLTNFCTANNTVAILSVGHIAKDLSLRYRIDPRKTASILDTCSCTVQGLIPYGAQLLMAGGLATISPVSIVPYMVYPLLIGLATVLAIAFRRPRRYS